MNTIEKKEFVAIWKKISNDEKRKPYFEDVKSFYYDWSSKKAIPFMQKIKNKGFIYPEHHILYNLVRNLPLDRGFQKDSEGFNQALDFFKGTPQVYRQNQIYAAFKEIIPNEQYCSLIKEVSEIIKTL